MFKKESSLYYRDKNLLNIISFEIWWFSHTNYIPQNAIIVLHSILISKDQKTTSPKRRRGHEQAIPNFFDSDINHPFIRKFPWCFIIVTDTVTISQVETTAIYGRIM